MYVVVRLWIREGREAEFEVYERKVARIMACHGGAIERTIRCSGTLLNAPASPFEVHVLRFPSNEQYEEFRRDPQREALSAERAAAISNTDVLLGQEGPIYGA
jgi:uncharacterized protein (DUF1330 family)